LGGRFTGKTDIGFAEFNRSLVSIAGCLQLTCAPASLTATAWQALAWLTGPESNEIKSAAHAILNQGQTDASYFDEPNSEECAFVRRGAAGGMIGDTVASCTPDGAERSGRDGICVCGCATN